MKNTTLLLCLLLCFPVAGKEKDEIASKKRWSSKSKLACAGALSAFILAMALLRIHPKKRHHLSDEEKYSCFTDDWKIGQKEKFVHFLTFQTLMPQGDIEIVCWNKKLMPQGDIETVCWKKKLVPQGDIETVCWNKKYETSIDDYTNKEVRRYIKRARDIYYETIRKKSLLGILIRPSELEKEFLRDVVSQRLNLLKMGDTIKNQLGYPDLKRLVLCCKEVLPQELYFSQ